MSSTPQDAHAAQWERQGDRLIKLRAHKQELQQQGVQGFELLEAMATLNLEHKIACLEQQGNRCAKCWHDTVHCICSELTSLEEDNALLDYNPPNVTLCILMHHKEYMGAGNSAKLLLSLLPKHTELYLYGKRGELDRLHRDVCNANVMILWPGPTALSVAEFTNQLDPGRVADRPMKAIVLDGTYTQARNMHTSLRKFWGVDRLPPSVAVHPTSDSVFHRAQKNYGKAHRQNQQSAKRVSTAEACGWLLMELGASSRLQNRIVQAVVANNQALAFARTYMTAKS